MQTITTQKEPTITNHTTEHGYDLVGNIIAFESGQLDEDDTIELFQHLIDTGLAWTLQGSYGRTANYLLEQGLCICKN